MSGGLPLAEPYCALRYSWGLRKPGREVPFRGALTGRWQSAAEPLARSVRQRYAVVVARLVKRQIDKEKPMPIDQKINYVELPARDFDAVEHFYKNAFGWQFTDFGPEYRAFTDGVIDGGFYKADASSSTKRGAALVIVYVDDLEKTRASVLGSGGTMLKEIFSFPGGRRFHFADPNGNELAVWSAS